MTNESFSITPDIQAALDKVYKQGLETGRLEGYAEGVRAAQQHLSTLPALKQPLLSLDTSIEDLDLCTRAYNCLKREGVHIIGELVNYTEQRLLGLKNFNGEALKNVISKLTVVGYQLKSDA